MLEQVSGARRARLLAHGMSVEGSSGLRSGAVAAPATPAAADHRKTRVLIIDDDRSLRETLVEALQNLGYDTASAEDGPTGLAAFGRHRADLVLLDLNLDELHGMEGIAVCGELKKIANGWIPVLFMTASADSKTKIQVLEAGGDDFLAKPFALDALGAQMRLLLRTVTREQGLKEETRTFVRIALQDELTGLGNRRALDRELARSFASMVRTGRPLTVIMADVDNFKAFNDRYGHATGDEVLKGVGAALARTIRGTDAAYRFGGEEFVVIAPEATPAGAVLLAERVRRAVERTWIIPSGSSEQLSVTISLGVGHAPGPATAAALLEAADGALYRAKLQGRNCVVVAEQPVVPPCE
jgi:diguanylate cyclase (GGDEF)-like protein